MDLLIALGLGLVVVATVALVWWGEARTRGASVAETLEPGWYGYPDAPGQERYWDGREWVATRPAALPPSPPSWQASPPMATPEASPQIGEAVIQSIEPASSHGITRELVAILAVVAVGAGALVYWFVLRSETKAATLTFDVIDISWEHSREPGGYCSGGDVSGGYGDITSLTPVKLETVDGKLLERYELGDGKAITAAAVIGDTMGLDVPDAAGGDAYACRFSTEISFTKGADGGKGFVVSVGRRGEKLVRWDELEEEGVLALSLS